MALNVLIIQENGIGDKKTKNHKECYSLKRAFGFHGCLVDIWGKDHPNFKTLPKFDSYDVIFTATQKGQGWLPNLKKCKALKVLWAFDDIHQGLPYYNFIRLSDKYRLVLHPSIDTVQKDFDVWFPNAFDDELYYYKEDYPKEHFLGFCGNNIKRRAFLNSIPDLRYDPYEYGEERVKAINSYRVHLNRNVDFLDGLQKPRHDINFRSFQTLPCRTLLLTGFDKQYEFLGFKHLENCLFYTSPEDLLEKIEWLKSNPIKIETMSKAAEIVSVNHTYKKRIGDVLDLIYKMI